MVVDRPISRMTEIQKGTTEENQTHYSQVHTQYHQSGRQIVYVFINVPCFHLCSSQTRPTDQKPVWCSLCAHTNQKRQKSISKL